MTAALLLALLATLTGLYGGRIRRLAWLSRHPRWGIIVWQALSWCFVASVVLAGASLAVPSLPSGFDEGLAHFIGACATAVRDHYGTPGGAVVAGLGAASAVTVLVRLLLHLAHDAHRLHAARARQRQAVRVVARPAFQHGAWLVEDDRPAAYCVPGTTRMVVLSTGTVSRLSRTELAAVLEHERAHLHGRHHLVIQFIDTLRRALPRVPVLETAATEVRKLVEMHADDRAARLCGRAPLARALLQLAATAPQVAPASVGSSAVTLHAAAADTVARVERLAHLPSSRSRASAGLALTAITLLLIAPIAAAAVPALQSLAHHYCPLPFLV